MSKQKIFKRAAVEKIRNDLRTGASLKTYFEDKFSFDPSDTIDSNIETTGKLTLKVPKKDLVGADLENIISLYEHYKLLDETQASDPRLWVYLSHVEFRKYTLARWGLGGTHKDLKDDSSKYRAVNQLLEHWFIGGNVRDLRRHSIARLWWAGHLTYAPWERDPEFFGDLKRSDPYRFTKILLFTQDIYQQVLERAMGRSNRILISVLEFLDDNRNFAESRENIRELIKELNLIFGTKKIIALDRQSLKNLIQKTASEIS